LIEKCVLDAFISFRIRKIAEIENDSKFRVGNHAVSLFLRLSKNYSFSDNLCFDFAKHGRPKVPMRKLSPSESMKTEVHALGFHAFAPQMLFHARCRAAASASRKRTLLTD